MSTNHNRIKVADLETNQPNKILKTNQNGELEFQNAENLSVELASDLETQINTVVPEDAKVISRSKLFNWWQWIKSQSQTISGVWNFSNKLILGIGNINTPALIIPSGTLTTAAQDGAIERDRDGNLFSTSLIDGRSKIITEKNAITLMTKFTTSNSDKTNTISSQSERTIKSFSTGFFPNKMFAKLNISSDYSFDYPYQGVQPTVLKIEYFLKITNGFFSTSTWGSNNIGQLFLFKNIDLLRSQSMNVTYTEDLSTTIRTSYVNNGDNGNRCGIGIGNQFYNIRKPDNSNNELPANCQFDIIERVTWQYNDKNNDALNNAYRRVITGVNAFYIERII